MPCRPNCHPCRFVHQPISRTLPGSSWTTRVVLVNELVINGKRNADGVTVTRHGSGHNQLPTALYSRLIAQDVRRDHKRVLQCLRFIASQDFLGIRPETTQRDSKRPLIREL
ncbi:hypothetical protein IWQ60_005917 [Tieghemiomyces parasiticus]|uniref:Uncharacterized protein n=1 Tax=Tieghemiomyces parasiticus TaxID=78921 RepID=A0A9W8ABF8_9FUNG|nr:hypothetical protein IWQ60_005917 [Tieghemiomyces parasiticus]